MLCPVMDRLRRQVAACGRVVRPELVMTLPRTVAEVLSEHVAFEVECIDRMYPLSELGGESSRFSAQAVVSADTFAVHDRTGRAARPQRLDRSAGGLGPADRPPP